MSRLSALAFFALCITLFSVNVHADSANNTALILLEGDIHSMNEVIDFIEENNGKVMHVFPPQILIARISPELEEELLKKENVLEVHFNAVNAEEKKELISPNFEIALNAWNNRFNKSESISSSAPPVILGDALIAPKEKLIEPVKGNEINTVNELGNFPPFGFYETSEFLIGSTAVGIVLPESNGLIDNDDENWTSQEESNVLSEIMDGLEWYIDKEPDAGISWIYDINLAVPTGYEPIKHPISEEGLWINELMNELGQGDGNPVTYFPDVYNYVNSLRDSYGTDWGFAVFVADSSNDGDGKFADGAFAYAYMEGPFTVMTYDNANYGIDDMDSVLAHETGHIFGAADQYKGAWQCDEASDCNVTWGFLGIENQNCQNLACSSNVDSIMRGGVYPFSNGLIDFYARGQLGWRDSDGDGVLDPIEITDNVVPEIGLVELYDSVEYNSYISSPISIRSEVNDLYSGIDVNSCEYQLTEEGEWFSGIYDGTTYCYAEGINVSDLNELKIKFKAKDNAGNEGISPESLDRIVDVSPPLISATQSSDFFFKPSETVLVTSEVSDNGSDVNDSSVFIYLQNPDETNALTELMHDDGSQGDENADDGIYSIELILDSLIDGNYFIDFTAEDNIGNQTEEENTLMITVDGTPPETPTIDSLPEFTIVNYIDLNWSSSPGSDEGSGIDYYLLWRFNGIEWNSIQLNATETSYRDENLSDGNYSYKLQAMDKAGNDSNSGIVGTVIDTLPPEIISQSPENNGYIGNSDAESFTVNYTEMNLDYINLFWDETWPFACEAIEECPPLPLNDCNSGTSQSCSHDLNLMNYADGNQINYYFGVFDKTGKSAYLFASDGNAFTVTIDVVAPIVATTEIYDAIEYNSYVGSPISIKSEVIEAVSGIDSSSCEYQLIEEGEWISGIYDGNNYCYAEGINVSDLNELNIIFRAKDNAGNQGIAESSLERMVDALTSIPVVSITGRTEEISWLNSAAEEIICNATDNESGVNENGFDFEFTAEDDSLNEWNAIEKCTNSDFNCLWEVPSDDVNISVRCRYRDNVGNASEWNKASYAGIDVSNPITADDAPLEWQNQDFNVNLNAIDYVSGTSLTQYRLNDGNWVSGTLIEINTDGNHEIQYYSTDNAGNIEETRTVYALLDKVDPETDYSTAAGWQTSDFNILFSPTDELSGINETYYRIDEGELETGTEIEINVDGNHLIEFYSVDNAGNNETVKQFNALLDKTNPIADAGEDLVVDVNKEINFNALDSMDAVSGIESYSWDFGDGGTAEEAETIHSFSEIGVYAVTLTVMDEAGNTATDELIVITEGTDYNATENLTMKFNSFPPDKNQSTLTVNEFSEIPPNSTGFLVNGNYFSIESDLVNGSFLVTLTFSYNDSDNDGIIDETGIEETTIEVYYQENSEWIAVADPERNSEENTISVTIDHFTFFALMFKLPTCSDGIQNQGEEGVDCGGPCASCSPPPTNTGGGGGGGGGCTPIWEYTEWSECTPEGKQTRTVTKSNKCYRDTGKPEEERECYLVPLLEEEETTPMIEETEEKEEEEVITIEEKTEEETIPETSTAAIPPTGFFGLGESNDAIIIGLIIIATVLLIGLFYTKRKRKTNENRKKSKKEK